MTKSPLHKSLREMASSFEEYLLSNNIVSQEYEFGCYDYFWLQAFIAWYLERFALHDDKLEANKRIRDRALNLSRIFLRAALGKLYVPIGTSVGRVERNMFLRLGRLIGLLWN